MAFDLRVYFERISLGGCDLDLKDLENLQRAQMSSIPFEDVEPFLGRVPDLSDEVVWTKLVLQRRGGYCFELNHLLGQALTRIGFKARPILARVRMGAAEGGIRAHLAWVVSLDGHDWLVDAGFGGPGPFGLLALSDANPQILPNGTFRFRQDEATRETVLERQEPSGWFPLFGFDETPFTPADIEGANFLCARSPVQPFSANLMMSMHHPNGYISVMNRNVKMASRAETRTWVIDALSDLQNVVCELLRLEYDHVILEKVWARLASDNVKAAA
ncbi:arylamine N-acetyltransferase family protein [Microvirga pakistanensis]|uniref:arylamine N-acetyltransferase family protein n=1 Tax=Microvirga pakistanensis TaxID=1682650 RepID=UPI00106BE51F|nr:arylamine N-acetyltransferase [Microvirga pakistanensis]